MARGLLDLANDMDRLADRLPGAIADVGNRVVITIVSDLAYKTPVDTSRALSNWRVNVGTPPTESILPHYPGIGGSTQTASAQETIAAAKAALKGRKAGQTIYIANRLPYIKRLNEGYSGQQPAGFVERSILVGRISMRSIKINLKG
ncbi:MAG: hypothetical protein JWR85_4176 [Marmoricola sp.]|nr:hypothetical protein [Marmoricola sp.]